MSAGKVYLARSFTREVVRWAPPLLAVGLMLIMVVTTLAFWLYRADVGDNGSWKVIVFVIASAWVSLAASAGSYYFSRRRGYDDQLERARMSEWQLFQRGLANDFKHISAREAEKLLSKDVIAATIDAKIDEAFVSGVDKALRKRLNQEAKVVDVIEFIEAAEQRIRTMLDGPASRAETRSGRLMIFAILIGAFGLFIAYSRVRGLGNLSDSLLSLKTNVGAGSVWPYIFALSAPWVTLIALVEFTALMMLRLSNKLSLEQRHYTELLVEFTDRMLALKAVARFGNADQVVAAASLLIKHNPKVEAKSEGLEESLSAITKITESLAAVVKQFAAKESKTPD
ncbi:MULTISPECIES: hypothetical protein [Agrobacterium]|uniref:hypothetical protein n=1 Tax=Agrobacterium TaxID=357 RepID=UPI002300B18D|nr:MULTISPECIES: hypothetical protein [Agrobacterium]MDA5627820.1 hypothetical protein [Agrobacterium sp. ST15.16.055]MDA6978434.1 hypothetical protein [Agrobacterium salinitolerans]